MIKEEDIFDTHKSYISSKNEYEAFLQTFLTKVKDNGDKCYKVEDDTYHYVLEGGFVHKISIGSYSVIRRSMDTFSEKHATELDLRDYRITVLDEANLLFGEEIRTEVGQLEKLKIEKDRNKNELVHLIHSHLKSTYGIKDISVLLPIVIDINERKYIVTENPNYRDRHFQWGGYGDYDNIPTNKIILNHFIEHKFIEHKFKDTSHDIKVNFSRKSDYTY